MVESKQKYAKPHMICPFCQELQENGNFRAFAVNGMTMHIRMMHPEKSEEFKQHRQQFIDRFACDEDGIVSGGQSKKFEVPEVEPVVIEEAIPEQEYVEPEEHIQTPPPVKTPKKIKPEPEVPKKEEFPDEREPGRDIYNPYGY